VKVACKILLLLLAGAVGTTLVHAQISRFQHIVVIFQENRTPDNLFQGLCNPPFGNSTSCSTTPKNNQYNIQTSNWFDKTAPGGVIEPLPVALSAKYDLSHRHNAFVAQCDLSASLGVCQMDGAAGVLCAGMCLSQPQLRFVDNSTGILNPYLDLAEQYGWANYMFQTNQGPSFPAHQFIFSGTSAASASDDASGVFAPENPGPSKAGCAAPAGSKVTVITPGKKRALYPCFEHLTISDLLPANVSWKYYSPDAKGIWTAPNSIKHICQPDQPTDGQCGGPAWFNNVDINPQDVLLDIANCKLAGVTWANPTAANSDHALSNRGGGPSWVASIVNAIGNSTCKNPDGSSYWNSTAIFITWDDWGGWYDHEPPTLLPLPQGDYQYGFRVPLIVVSAYTDAGYIDNKRYDFGSILRYIERNFGIAEGALLFADARATNNLTPFFHLKQLPRPFVPISAPLSASHFLLDKTPPADPDDDY
jgi:phospholipase C